FTYSLLGALKVAADIMVQEYGRYFDMPTCCLRVSCLTGPHHAGVELHGFLSYLVKCNLEGREYKVYGYKGKQVRDNIHSYDVARFIHAFVDAPRAGEVYNLGGGNENACSVLEAFALTQARTGRELKRLGVRVLHADIRMASDFEALPAVDAVIDAAANPSVLAGVDGTTSSRQVVEHNLGGTIEMLELCRRQRSAFVLLSTSRV